jgi:hypothetical protein
LKRIFVAMCAWLGLAATGAHAAAMSPDPTGIWYDPASPGWGLSITQQGETTFAVLFVYDENHKPAWYVASNVADTGMHLDPIGSEIFSGDLFRTTGSSLTNASFDPSSVTTTKVGYLTLAKGPAAGTLMVSYSLTGNSIFATVQPQIWADATPRLVGGYAGGIFFRSTAACAAPDYRERFGFGIEPGPAPRQVQLSWGTGTDTGCWLEGSFTQTDQTGTLSGPFICGPIGSTFPGLAMTLSEIVIGPHGFSAAAMLALPSCTLTGNAGGALLPATPATAGSMQPDPTGIWYDLNAPGYGLSLTQQGNDIFAALFTYGTDSKAQWLVASNVVDLGTSVFVPADGVGDLNGVMAHEFGGTLYRTTGATAGAANDSTPFSVANAGSLKVRYGAGGPYGSVLVLTYTVDGTTATRTLQRQTWSGNSLGGAYAGGLLVAATGSAGCDSVANAGSNFQITISQSQASTQIAWSPVSGTQCSVSGTFAPAGNFSTFSGSGQCTSNATPGSLNPFTITEMSVTPHGFSGSLSYSAAPALLGGTCSYTGTIGGARLPQ